MHDDRDISSLATKLRQFTTKHRPSIARAGVRALGLQEDISRCQRNLLVIFVQARPGRTRSETAFYAAATDIRAIDSFGDKSPQIRQQLANQDKFNKQHGAVATLFVMLWCIDLSVSNMAPIGVWQSALDEMKNVKSDWAEEMISHLNEGIVL